MYFDVCSDIEFERRRKHGLYQSKLWQEDPLGKTLDDFIGEWNRQAKEIEEKHCKLVLEWARY